jgi:hypothetical protein
LDVINVAWVKNYINSLTHVTAIMVSHDSGFLNDCCTHILAISSLKLTSYKVHIVVHVIVHTLIVLTVIRLIVHCVMLLLVLCYKRILVWLDSFASLLLCSIKRQLLLSILLLTLLDHTTNTAIQLYNAVHCCNNHTSGQPE